MLLLTEGQLMLLLTEGQLMLLLTEGQLMLLLTEGQLDDPWEPSNKAELSRISESIEQKSTFRLFLQIFKLLSVLL